MSLRRSHSAVDACNATLAVLSRRSSGGALIAALLHVQDRLRCVAATGSWQVYSSVPLGRGVVGRVYATGKPVTLPDVSADPDYVELGKEVLAEICVPVLDRAGQPIGVLNAEWTSAIPLDGWEDLLSEVGQLLGARVEELGGPPPETRGEQLLRHSMALTEADTDIEVLTRACRAAREVTGLAAAVLLRSTPAGVMLAASSPEQRDRPLVARLAHTAPERLNTLVELARRHGAAYSIGDPALLNARGFEALTDSGVRTMIAVPLGSATVSGALIALDESVSQPEPAMVNLLELLAAQAGTCLEKLSNLRALHRQANSDPLTGLGHRGPFDERLANAMPERTALLAIDVDELKALNDSQGHEAGDRLLVELAGALQGALRQGDELFRIGGDEFVAVVDVPSAGMAIAVAERLNEAARAVGGTVSIGVAVQGATETSAQTLRRADKALYAAKRSGRNTVRFSSS
ncbi:diguanylate cyclase [Allorhizocola rhizosphaerae]|uniref:diguanylate cyclase n=1 Tax=Allorhizocola rhizosphaerae TaxID=1872709 RepID=UPI000E3EAB80|nr:diguanylate cyclase [Allorhizocola rhizosphaerae]